MLEKILINLYGVKAYNWPIARGGMHFGKFEIKNGSVSLPLFEGQYFRIVGSIFNDGVYKYGEKINLIDETFEGAVWALAIPKPVLNLANEIEAWEEKNGAVASGVYQSESFGGYTYTKATDAQTGQTVTWESAFRSQLNAWRKV